MGIMLHASATAEPPDDPPHVRAVSNGFTVAPQTGLVVLAPAPNTGTLVLQKTIAPASRKWCTTDSSLSGTWSL